MFEISKNILEQDFGEKYSVPWVRRMMGSFDLGSKDFIAPLQGFWE